MSKQALSKYLDEVLAKVPVEELGKIANKREISNTSSFRGNLNKTVHILLINDYFIKSLAPRAEDLLKTLPSAVGPDGNTSAVRAILTEYRSMRGNKRGRVRKTKVGGGEPGYVLTFASFDAVRSFLSRLGLKGRSSEILNFVKTNADIRARLEKLIGKESFATENALVSALSNLRPDNNKSTKDPFYNNKEAAELYRTIYDSDLGFDVGHNIPVAYKQVELFASNKALLKSVVEKFTAAMGGSAKLTSSSINAVVKEVQQAALLAAKNTTMENNFVVLKEELDKRGHGAVTVFIESSKANQDSESEARITNQFRELLLTRIKAQLRGKDAAIKLLNQPGSKNYTEQLTDAVLNAITKKPTKSQGTSVGKSKLKSSINTNSVSSKVSNATTQNVRMAPLRSVRGQFASQTNLFALITALLPKVIETNMQSPNLNYQTGRFAESVELKGLETARDGSVTAFLTYMKYPYETYEPGFARGYLNKSPTRLIDQSVREIASGLVLNRLRTVII